MPMSPYILVLAKNANEGATYVRRAKLPRGRWRIVAKASSIRGIRQAHVHRLPSFEQRPDRHAIVAELRHARCVWIDVEMPPAPEAPIEDQGDGMGPQLSIEDALAEVDALAEAYDGGTLLEPASNTLETAKPLEGTGHFEKAVIENALAAQASQPGPMEPPRAKRRSRCTDCGDLHFKDEPCARVDGVEEAPVAIPATMFD